jgi:hypothetical protein
MRNLASDLKEVFALPSVDVLHLEAVTSKNIYNDLTSTPPPSQN